MERVPEPPLSPRSYTSREENLIDAMDTAECNLAEANTAYNLHITSCQECSSRANVTRPDLVSPDDVCAFGAELMLEIWRSENLLSAAAGDVDRGVK